jgi:hypothetical protein
MTRMTGIQATKSDFADVVKDGENYEQNRLTGLG